MIRTELCQFQTSDDETLHGLLLRPAGESNADTALVYGHGVAHNFYLTPLVRIGQALAEQGRHGFVYNWRGHDWVARAGADGTGFRGAAYERMEDAPLDLDGVLAALAQRSYRRFILVGHSLGGVKAVHYQGLRQREDVAAVVACSPPRLFYAARMQDQPEFPETLAQAQRLVADGRPNEFVWAIASGSVGLLTAGTILSKYGPAADTDVRPAAGRLGVPLLALAGGAEAASFALHVRELASAAGPLGTSRIIDGANHEYTGQEAEVTQCIAEWLASHRL